MRKSLMVGVLMLVVAVAGFSAIPQVAARPSNPQFELVDSEQVSLGPIYSDWPIPGEMIRATYTMKSYNHRGIDPYYTDYVTMLIEGYTTAELSNADWWFYGPYLLSWKWKVLYTINCVWDDVWGVIPNEGNFKCKIKLTPNTDDGDIPDATYKWVLKIGIFWRSFGMECASEWKYINLYCR